MLPIPDKGKVPEEVIPLLPVTSLQAAQPGKYFSNGSTSSSHLSSQQICQERHEGAESRHCAAFITTRRLSMSWHSTKLSYSRKSPCSPDLSNISCSSTNPANIPLNSSSLLYNLQHRIFLSPLAIILTSSKIISTSLSSNIPL